MGKCQDLIEEQRQVLVCRADAGNAEFFHQHLRHVRGQKAGERWSQMDVLDSKVQKREEDDDGLLLIPADVIRDGQLVHVVKAENLLELQRDKSEGIRVVALARVENAGYAADIAERELIVAVFRAARREDNGIGGELFGKLRVVGAGFHPAVAARHDEELTDSAGFYGLHHLVGQGKDLIVGKAADYRALFYLLGRRKGLCEGDDLRKVLFSVFIRLNVRTAGEARGIGGKDAGPYLLAAGRNDAVRGKKYGTAKGLEFLKLPVPSVAVVSGEMEYLLKAG